MTMLDEDTIVLDETILHDEAPCAVCRAGATVHVRARCCGDEGLLCSTHLERARESIRREAPIYKVRHTACGLITDVMHSYEQMFEVRPV